jgi:hypothetical protein
VLIIPSSWGSQLDGDLHQHRAATSNNALIQPDIPIDKINNDKFWK